MDDSGRKRQDERSNCSSKRRRATCASYACERRLFEVCVLWGRHPHTDLHSEEWNRCVCCATSSGARSYQALAGAEG